jgi:hypothetical protein
MKKEDFIALAKGSIDNFELRKDGTNYKKSSLLNESTSSNYVELLKHTAGLQNAIVIEFYYSDGKMKCMAHITPVLQNDSFGKPYFASYKTTSPENVGNKDAVFPTLDLSIEEVNDIRQHFEKEFQNRKEIYSKELEESKQTLFKSWMDNTIKK